ncbi:MAG: hypothetical protein OXI96_06170 [Acidimicrobiaceae bacterium]|nr:hypothetical protein [Acidimicrobiaceae bacterium]
MEECSYDDAPSYADRYRRVGSVYRHSNGSILSQIFSLGNKNLTVDVRPVVDWADTRINDKITSKPECNLDLGQLGQDITKAKRKGRNPYLFGGPYNANYKFDIHPDMVAPLNSAVVTIDYFARVYGDNYGRLKVIGQGGTIRNRTGSDSFHYHGKAIDIWWLGWENQQQGGTVVHTASRPCNGAGEVSSSLTAHRRLVAVEAGLRKWFGYVLNRNIAGHHNHFHVDNGCLVALRVDNEPEGLPILKHQIDRFVRATIFCRTA